MSIIREATPHDARPTTQDILYQLARDLARAPDVRTIADHLFARTKTLLNADYGFLGLANADSTELRGVAGYGLDPDLIRQERVNIQSGSGPVSLAFRQRKPVIVPRIANTPLWSERLRSRYPFVQDLWCSPLMNGDKAIGVLVIGYAAFQEETTTDLQLFQLLGDEAALALERARLTEELRESEARSRELFTTAQDATRALQTTNEMLQALLRASPLAIVALDVNGSVLFWNPAAEHTFGWSAEEALGHPYPIIPQDQWQDFLAHHQRVWQGETFTGVEISRRKKDGTFIDVSTSTALLRDTHGMPVAAMGVIADITTRKQAEAALQEEGKVAVALAQVGQELISSLNTPAIFDRLCRLTAEALDADYSFTTLWQPAENAYVIVAGYGETREQTEIRRAFKVPPERFTRLFARLEQEGVVERATESLRDPVEQSVLRSFRIGAALYFPLRRNNQIIGLQNVWYRKEKTVYPHHKRIAQGIAQIASFALANLGLFEELTKANQLKEEFIGSVSHELRTPLNIIMGYTELLRDETFGPLNAQQQQTLGRIDHSSRELLDLINATLDLSRLQSKGAQTEGQPVDIAQFFTDLAVDVRQLAKHSILTIEWRLAPDLPLLITDHVKLRMILKNLIINALKFTEHGGITISADRQADNVSFTVRDTGIGIASEALPFIFEPFRQVDNSVAPHKRGVGLGLYIVRQLVELLGGSVSVTSTLGIGSTFHISLPLRHESH
jgi:PAS domain S-box-containing protein